MRYLIVAVLLVLLFSSAAQADENLFKSVTVGFELTKPEKWQFLSAQAIIDTIKIAKQ